MTRSSLRIRVPRGLDILINNASSLGPTPLAPLADTECEDLEQALAVNLLGPFRLTKALFGALAASARNRRGAVVINISSDAAISAYPGWGAYGASKAGRRHLTAIWHEEARDDGVHFLSVDPGDMDTPLHAAAIHARGGHAVRAIAALQSAQVCPPTIAAVEEGRRFAPQKRTR